MTTLPSLDNLSPDRWIDAMQTLRDEVIEDAASILDTRTVPTLAASPLQQVLDRYSNLDVGLPTGTDGSGAQFSLEVRPQSDMLTLWAFPTEDYESIVYTEEDYWWFDHRGIEDASRDRHEIHCAVVRRILEMLPWANEDDLLEIVAIEMSTRAGE
jgi:hypothetical protein